MEVGYRDWDYIVKNFECLVCWEVGVSESLWVGELYDVRCVLGCCMRYYVGFGFVNLNI